MPSTSAIVQLVHAPMNERFHKEPTIYEDMVAKAKAEKGVVAIYYGLKVDDPNTLIGIDCLENYEAFSDFRSSSGWIPMVQTAMTICSAPFNVVHIPVDATQVLSGPIVAISTLNVRPDGEMQPVLEALRKYEELAKQASDCKGGVYASTRQDINQIISISSWTSKEAHEEFAKKPECVALSQQLQSVIVSGGNEYVKIIKA